MWRDCVAEPPSCSLKRPHRHCRVCNMRLRDRKLLVAHEASHVPGADAATPTKRARAAAAAVGPTPVLVTVGPDAPLSEALKRIKAQLLQPAAGPPVGAAATAPAAAAAAVATAATSSSPSPAQVAAPSGTAAAAVPGSAAAPAPAAAAAPAAGAAADSAAATEEHLKALAQRERALLENIAGQQRELFALTRERAAATRALAEKRW
jgi:hypothetical protein